MPNGKNGASINFVHIFRRTIKPKGINTRVTVKNIINQEMGKRRRIIKMERIKRNTTRRRRRT